LKKFKRLQLERKAMLQAKETAMTMLLI